MQLTGNQRYQLNLIASGLIGMFTGYLVATDMQTAMLFWFVVLLVYFWKVRIIVSSYELNGKQ